MLLRPPISTRNYTPLPHTTVFRYQDDVVSGAGVDRVIAARPAAFLRQFRIVGADIGDRVLTIPVAAIAGGIDRFGTHPAFERLAHRPARSRRQSGRPSCRERVCPYV